MSTIVALPQPSHSSFLRAQVLFTEFNGQSAPTLHSLASGQAQLDNGWERPLSAITLGEFVHINAPLPGYLMAGRRGWIKLKVVSPEGGIYLPSTRQKLAVDFSRKILERLAGVKDDIANNRTHHSYTRPDVSGVDPRLTIEGVELRELRLLALQWYGDSNVAVAVLGLSL
ncbi:hypothetical protein V5O48_008112 [Marasmius crinis-equi]|uniref:Uncharacterized protein n=1 Tax=Marasmius crinis-equi TaxID=585013 RepID=A0ABR3EXM6_9AGAR